MNQHARPVVLLLSLVALVLRAEVVFIDDDSVQQKLQQHLERYAARTNRVLITRLEDELSRTSAVVKLARPLTRERDWAEVYERARDSVLVVGQLYKCERCSKWHLACASGAIVSSDGVLLTNYHVVESERGEVMGAMRLDGTFFPVVEVLAANKREDVALVRLEGEDFQPLPLLAEKPVGSAVAVLSHPDQSFYTLTAGIISRYCAEPVVPRGKARRRNMMITADYAKGSSGAPVLDDCGNVVGIASSTVSVYYDDDHGVQKNLQQVIKYCVPARCALDLIQPAK